jgi:hypothetical protein
MEMIRNNHIGQQIKILERLQHISDRWTNGKTDGRFRIISIPSIFFYFRPPDHVISMELLALNFWCPCTQQKLQSICAVLTFDPQLQNILTFSVKDRYQLNYFICITDFNEETNTSLK